MGLQRRKGLLDRQGRLGSTSRLSKMKGPRSWGWKAWGRNQACLHLGFLLGTMGRKLVPRGASSFLYATLVIIHWFILLTCWATAIKYWVLHGDHQDEQDKVWTPQKLTVQWRKGAGKQPPAIPWHTCNQKAVYAPGPAQWRECPPGSEPRIHKGDHIWVESFCFYFFKKKKIIYLAAPVLAVVCGIQFPSQGLSLGPLHWGCRVLGKSSGWVLRMSEYQCPNWQ